MPQGGHVKERLNLDGCVCQPFEKGVACTQLEYRRSIIFGVGHPLVAGPELLRKDCLHAPHSLFGFGFGFAGAWGVVRGNSGDTDEVNILAFCLTFHQQMKEYFVINFGAGVREDDGLGERKWEFRHGLCFGIWVNEFLGLGIQFL